MPKTTQNYLDIAFLAGCFLPVFVINYMLRDVKDPIQFLPILKRVEHPNQSKFQVLSKFNEGLNSELSPLKYIYML